MCRNWFMKGLMLSFTITFSTFNLVKAAKTANTPAHYKTSRSVDSIEKNMNLQYLYNILFGGLNHVYFNFVVPT